MYVDVFETSVVNVFKELSSKAQKLGFDFHFTEITWDTSRSWSLYVSGSIIGVNVGKFGAYRNYYGGGVRGPICHNGREQEKTLALGSLFVEALTKLEWLYNEGYEEDEPWERPTGVLL